MVHCYAVGMHPYAPPPALDLLTPRELAIILHKSEATIRSDVHRAPTRLPPRLLLPNCNKLLWLRITVETWLVQHQVEAAQ